MTEDTYHLDIDDESLMPIAETLELFNARHGREEIESLLNKVRDTDENGAPLELTYEEVVSGFAILHSFQYYVDDPQRDYGALVDEFHGAVPDSFPFDLMEQAGEVETILESGGDDD